MPDFLVRSVRSICVWVQHSYCYGVVFADGILFNMDGVTAWCSEQIICEAMARKKVNMLNDAISIAEKERVADALLVMKKRSKTYKPVPKFKGGCKDC